MNTIEKKVEAAMRATQFYYNYFAMMVNNKIPETKSMGIYYRTLAVVKHDRLLNGR